LGSLKYLAEAGAPSATYFETVGRKGVMGLDPAVGPAAAKGDDAPWMPVFPVYWVFREVADFTGGEVRSVDSSNPLAAVALALQKPGELRVLAANLTERPRSVAIHGLSSPCKVSLLYDDNTKSKTPAPEISRNADNGELALILPPHAIARIDVAND
jgi:hypothetical protein